MVQIDIVQTLSYRRQITGADPGYVKKGGGASIQKGGRVADITPK